LPFENVLFEVFSAIGTVGMSTGVTRDLNSVSRVVIILLMYCGRVGSLSFAVAFARRNTTVRVRSPKEKVVVG
jgi:trk system potassium uptake protein TrkH